MEVVDTKQLRRHLMRMPRQKLELLAVSIFTLRRREKDPLNQYREKYMYRPLDWADSFVEIELPNYLRRALQRIQDGCHKLALHGPHGIGKTVFASLIVLWAASTSYDCKVITTASAWRQLTKYLWPEIHKWSIRVNWQRIGHFPNLLRLEGSFSETSKAFAVACTNAATIEGAHAERVVYLYDEAKSIPPATWEASEGAFSTPGRHLQIALSTPGEATGVYYDVCSRQKGYEEWAVLYVSPREAIRAGRMSLEWAKSCRKKWGASNPIYLNRVWGLFAAQGEDNVIPLRWIELAVERWHTWHDDGALLEGKHSVGGDVSRGGADRTALAHRYDRVISEIEYYQKDQTRDTMVTAGRVVVACGDDGTAKLDVIGIGAGVVDRCRETMGEERVVAINAGAGTKLTDRSGELHFANIRAAMWWNMRELLDPSNHEDYCLPDDPELIGDLCAPKWAPNSAGKIQIESKELIKKRLGRSTDSGDSVCQACFDGLEMSDDFVYVG